MRFAQHRVESRTNRPAFDDNGGEFRGFDGHLACGPRWAGGEAARAEVVDMRLG
jgi:hypothetical protein